MNAIVQLLNTAGRAFVDFAVPMLVQSSVLIVILLAVDAVLRKRVRAVFRYWIWMLVLVKLVLPPSLWSPVSVGTWFGDKLKVSTTALFEASALPPGESPEIELSPAVTNILSRPQRVFVEPPLLDPAVAPPSPLPTETANRATPIDIPPALSLNWQGFTLLVWAAVVTALLLLLAQRTFFVQGLVAQADEASGTMLRELDECRRHLGLRRPISLRLSPHAASPAVCGLLRPTILVPQTLASRLHGADLQAVLLHELAHVQRGDLWINVIQTLLQIVYFYNPLLWLANTAIRRIREKAVDETVLVAMGEAAQQYPETLVNVAKLALARRPALSLRLIGVVESKSALTSRIKHILNRPLPKTAKLGGLGLIAVLITAAVLLPMARVEAGPTPIRGIEEDLDLSDQSGHLRLRSLHMAPPDGKRIVGMNETSLAVQVENTAPQEAYLGLEYYADAGSVAAGAFSPGTSSRTQVRPVPPHWQGTLTYPISYVRFVKNGYIQIRLAKCRNAQTRVFASPEAEVLYDKKYSIFADEDLQTIEPTEDSSAANLNRNESSIRESHDALANSTVAQDQFHDSDGDGLSDYDEIHKYLTDPAKKDSDGDGIPDSDWNERREYTYSVRTVLRYLPPVDEKALNDDFQDGRVLKQTDEYIEVEVIHYPLATGYDSIPENRNWRLDDAQMTEYLAPGATTNWDEPMRRDLIAALKADGIDIETLSDKQVVEQVSRWLLKRSRYLDKVFTTWYIHFPQGKPAVYPGLEDAFRHEFERDKNNYDWTLDQHFDHELLGKGMFYNKTHGSCTSTAVYLTTVLRALGIPTRMVLVAPAVDASNREQILMVKKTLTHNRVRETMLAGLRRSSRGFTNHTLNEVYVGGRWRRLDYDQLGRPAFGVDRFGLQTHLYTVNDLSDVDLAATWGVRYAKGERNDLFRHDNPYTAVEVSELFGPHGQVPNPPCTAQELDPHPQPDVFIFYPSRGGGVWDAFVDIVGSTTANKTGRYQLRESYENLSGGTWLIRPQDILVLLFALDTPERVPDGYEDLLPKPWLEIESQLQQGQTVELSGKARGMNVIVLAAPTADGLKPLVQSSKLLRAIGGTSPAPGVDPPQPSAISQSAAKPVKLGNGATVELLGVCEYPSEGKQWWRPDGALLDVAPYQTTRNKRELQEGSRDYELVVRYGGAPDMDIEWSIPDSANTGVTGSPYDANGQSVRDLTVCTVRFPQTQTAANLRIGVAAGAWETRAVHRTMDREGAYNLASSQTVAFGRAHFQEGRTLVPVTTNFSRDDLDFRVVAVRGQEEVCTGSLSGAGDGNLRSMTYLFNCPLREIKEFRVQTRPWTWVEFQDVALRPGLRARTQAALLSAEKAKMRPRRSPGAEKVLGIGPAWEVLRDALPGRYQGSIGGFTTDNRRCAEYFEKVLSWTRPGDAFVLMLAFDQPVGVPPEYRDLLPLPWAEIESRVQGGQTVEAQGTARDLTVIVLAAPTSEQLDILVPQTHLLDAFRTDIRVQVRSDDADVKAASAAGADQEKEIVLPEVDRQGVVLDLATGVLIPLPPAGPEPQKLEQALRELGKGDLLYDCDSGDRTLILVRDATSAQAQGDMGEPPWKGYLIGPHLPGVLTVKTTEGRQYKVTILAADDAACTLQYSLISTDRGAGGGAPAELTKGEVAGEPGLAPHGVNIYLLADESIDLKTARATPLSGLVLRKEPWLASADIERYDLSSHALELKNPKPLPFRSVALRGNPFVVTADGQRCYLGSLWSHVSSLLPEQATPLIYLPSFAAPPEVVFIEGIVRSSGSAEPAQDVRQDPRVVQALTANGQLHAGLEISLDRVEVLPREGGSSVRYTYTLRNRDADNLYVLDPDKMSVGLFHYFNNAPLLRSARRVGGFPADTNLLERFEAPDRLDMAWFSLLKSTASMTRTVTIAAYPRIPPDRYVCSLRFDSPGRLATKDKRERTDGRIWVGQIHASLSLDPGPGELTTSPLELRIAPKQGELGPDAVQEYRKALAEGRSLADSRCVWAAVRPGMKPAPDLVTQTHQGKTWLLVHNAEPFIMVPAQGWRLAHVGRGIDDSGRPLVMLEFDEAGMERLRQLTKANGDKPLAEIVNGVVVAAPVFVKGQGGLGSAVIPGNFTEQEINDMMASLRRGTTEPFANTGGDFPPIRLRNGVMVELLGLCEHPSIGKRWWRPDGSLLTERPYDDDDGRAFPKPGEKGYKLAVRFSGLAGQDVGAYVIPSNSKTTNGGTLDQISEKNGKKNAEYLNGSVDEAIVWQGVAFDAELDSCDIRVGVSQGPWKSEYRQEVGKSSDTVEWAVFKDVSLRPQRGTNTGKGTGGGALAGSEKGDTTRTEDMATATVWGTVSQRISRRVVDSNGNSVAGAQVALCTKDKGVDIQAGQLLPTKWSGKGGEIVKTDAQGRFSFASAPDEFHLIAAHDTGFAWVTSKELAASGDLRLEPWSRIDGTLKIGRELGAGERISLQRGGNRSAADQNIHFDYETYADAGGRFTFEKVPPIWIEVGYMIRVGDAASSYTGRTPVHLLPGQNLRMTLGGEGRPVIGKFVPPTGYQGPIYFGQGLRALVTVHPDLPKPANYDQMTKREQQEWLTQWYKTAEAEAYYDTLWHDPNRRHYTFRIEDDGTFRIEDVIPGQYKFTIWLEERDSGQGRPEEIGAYYGVIEVPAIPGGRTDEPLDLGNLTLTMHNPALHVGDMAPLFEAKTLDGKDIHLADYRGQFVLLSFWQPVSHPELDRLRELHKTYGGAGKLAVIDFGGWDTLEEVRKYVAEHQMEWPEIYFGPSNKEGIANQYGLPGVPYILLVNPEGKIVATWLWGEKLTQTVKDALGQTN